MYNCKFIINNIINTYIYIYMILYSFCLHETITNHQFWIWDLKQKHVLSVVVEQRMVVAKICQVNSVHSVAPPK